MARPRTAQAVEPRRPGVGDASKRPIGRRSARTGAPATDHAPRRGISGRRHPHGPGDAPQWEHSAPSPCQEAELPVGCPERGPSGHWAAQTPASGPLDTRFRRTLQPSPSHVGAAHGPAWINAAHAGGTSYMYPLLAQGGMPSADGMRRWAIPQHALSHPLTPAAPAGRAVGPVPKFHLASGVLSSGGASGPGAPPGAQNGGRTRRATTAPGSRTSAAAAAAPATTTSQQSSPLHLSAAARTKAETRLRKLAPPPLALAPLAARGASADGGDGDGGGSFMYPPSRPSPGDSSSEDGRALAAFASGHPDGRLTPDWAPYGPATRPSGGFTPLLPPHYHSAHAIVPPGFPGASWMHPGWPPTPAAVDPRAFMWSPYYGMPTQWVANSAGSADLNAPWNVDAQGQGQGSMGHASSVDPAPQGLSAAAAAVAGASTAAAAAAAAATDAMAGTGHGSGTLPPYPRSSDADHLAAAVAIAGMSRGAPAAGGGQGSPARGRMQAASSSAPSKVRPGKSDGQPSHQPRGAAAATLRAQKRTRMRIPAAMARQRLNERVAAASALKRKRPPQSSDEGGGKRRRSSRSRVLSPVRGCPLWARATTPTTDNPLLPTLSPFARTLHSWRFFSLSTTAATQGS